MADKGPIRIGICGGSGLYKMEALKEVEEVLVDTPFGLPSDKYIVGTLDGVRVAFLARHGRGHHLTPTEVNYKANIYGFKKLGVQYILSASAVGSLKEETKPLDVVLADQFIDRTTRRDATFFGQGIVGHVSFGDPICPKLRGLVHDAIKGIKLPDAVKVHNGGTYVCMEGPAFSTKAESHMYRAFGGSIIGMTNLTEAKLAREAEIAYTSICMVTDYDCWHPDHDSVTVEMVIKNLHANAALAQEIILESVKKISASPPASDAHSALKFAIMTNLKTAPASSVQRLDALLKKYL